jgi:hypothetical protein
MKMSLDCMIALCACCFLSGGALAADEQPAAGKQQAAAASPKPKPLPPPPVVPGGATETAPGTYSFTDAQGGKWIFRQTPFGLVKFEDRPPSAADLELEKKRAELYHAFDEGDAVRFERPSPFGTYRWRTKKTELDPFEQTVWDRDRARQSATREKE